MKKEEKRKSFKKHLTLTITNRWRTCLRPSDYRRRTRKLGLRAVKKIFDSHRRLLEILRRAVSFRDIILVCF